MIDVDVVLLDPKKADIGVVRNIRGTDPGHLQRQKSQHQKGQQTYSIYVVERPLDSE